MSGINFNTAFIANNAFIQKVNNYTSRAIAFKGAQKDEFIRTTPAIKQKETIDNNSQVDPKAKLDEGVQLYKKGDYKGCIAALTQSIENSGDNPQAQAYHCRGSANRVLGNYDEALSDYDRALELCPDSTNTIKLRGKTSYLKATNTNPSDTEFAALIANAIKDFDFALETKPDVDTYKFKSDALIATGDYKNASETFYKGIDLGEKTYSEYQKNGIKNNDSEYLNGLLGDMHHINGNCLKKQGKYDEAYNEYSNAINHVPNSSNSYSARGVVSYTKLINTPLKGKAFKETANSAIADFDKAFELSPKSTIKKYKANVYMALGDWKSAISAFNEGISLSEAKIEQLKSKSAPNSKIKAETSTLADMHHIKGTALTYLANNSDDEILKQAIDEYSKALEYAPKSSNTMKLRGRTNYYRAANCNLKNGEFKAAIDASIKDYNSFLNIKKDSEIYRFKADSYMLAGDWKNASESLDESIKYDETRLENLQQSGKPSKKQISALTASIADCHHIKANCLLNLENYDEAYDEYSKALEYAPNSSNTLKSRGRTSYLKALSNNNLNENEKRQSLLSSISDYNEAISINPDSKTYEYMADSYDELQDYTNSICAVQIAIDMQEAELSELSNDPSSEKYKLKQKEIANLYSRKSSTILTAAKTPNSTVYREAAKAMTKAIELNPDCANYYYLRADINAHISRKECEADIRKAIKLDPAKAEYWDFLGGRILAGSEDSAKRNEAFDAMTTSIMLKNRI